MQGLYIEYKNTASGYSNKPGKCAKAQNQFLFDSLGDYELPHLENYITKGTSYAGPKIALVVAFLCGIPGVTPPMAAQALMESADKRDEKEVYGSGTGGRDKAEELLRKRLRANQRNDAEELLGLR